jgi:hypothetical protein
LENHRPDVKRLLVHNNCKEIQMIELVEHKVNGCNNSLTVTAIDDPGIGEAHHLYKIEGFDSETNPSCPFTESLGEPATNVFILFQQGPIASSGTNGVTHEALLAIIADRLRCFQKGKFSNSHNATALAHVELALEALKERTQERLARGVEGTHQV